MDTFKQRVSKQLDSLNEELHQYSAFRFMEYATGFPKIYVALVLSIFASMFLFFGLGDSGLCNLVGFIYPMFMSFKALESEEPIDIQWLAYWIIFSFFLLLENFLELLLFWFPFYYAFKIGFLIFCFLPGTRGASFVFQNILRPLLKEFCSSVRMSEDTTTNNDSKKDK